MRYRATRGYGLYATRGVPQDAVVIKYEEREHVLVTKVGAAMRGG